MQLLHHSLSHYFSKVVHHLHAESSVLYHTSSLDAWPSELVDKPDRFVAKIESCSAHTMTPGHDGCPPVVDKQHYHTFLRVTLSPSKDHPEETVFIERMLIERDKAAHSVIPVATDPAFLAQSTNGDTLHDHACVILEGSPSTLLHTHHVYVDRTVLFADCQDRHLSLYELATVARFVSAHGLRAVSIGVDTACETYSKWFSRAILSALSPEIMRGSFRHLTPRQGMEAAQIEIAMQRSVDAWLGSTFKTYPLKEVAAENFTRQMSVMNEVERALMNEHVRKQEVEKDKEMMHHAMVDAIERVREEWRSGESDGEISTKKGRAFMLREDSEQFQLMMRAATEVQRAWLLRLSESRLPL